MQGSAWVRKAGYHGDPSAEGSCNTWHKSYNVNKRGALSLSAIAWKRGLHTEHEIKRFVTQKTNNFFCPSSTSTKLSQGFTTYVPLRMCTNAWWPRKLTRYVLFLGQTPAKYCTTTLVAYVCTNNHVVCARYSVWIFLVNFFIIRENIACEWTVYCLRRFNTFFHFTWNSNIFYAIQ